MSKVAALFMKDVRVVTRDYLLSFMVFYPLVLAFVLRFVPEWFPIEHFDVYLAPVAGIMMPLMIGVVFGLALIEERENQTWLLLRVVPLGTVTLLGYFVAATGGLSFVTVLAGAWLYGMRPADPVGFAALAVSASLTAPLIAFLIGALSSNKIEGLVVAKVVGLLPMSAALVFLLGPAWQLTLAWNPYYWLYLGAIAVYTDAGTLGDLALRWPGYTLTACTTVSTSLSAVALWALSVAYRRRAA